ncbi:hypothetical protein Acr_28g0007400 [Actinidia rufa]|uniref:Uncharacterized protein n=1 Tax=Actinidia rufa TaxID=165716 RepID=A0A7J0HAN3_9ERIC|nr:hypothetical protein Acr_28g0007400 [Actinidia rufa]
MVATKPHYFLDLDVQQTVENFLENVPEFWSSDEFAASLEDGEILFIDTKFYVDLFVDLMFTEDSKEVTGSPIPHKCSYMPRPPASAACARGREDGVEKVKIKDVVQICMCSCHPNSLASIAKQCFKAKTIDTVKWLGLQSWALHCRLSEECRTRESWESLFIDNGISFRKSDNYEVLHHDGFSEGLESDLDERASGGVRRKKKEKHRKKRRKNLDDDDESYDNELLDLDMPKKRLSLQSRGGGLVTFY